MNKYQEFLATKKKQHKPSGIEVSKLHSSLFPFQQFTTDWALRTGRACIFAGTGLGKTRMQVEYNRHLPGIRLILAPLAVNGQTVLEARDVFGTEIIQAEKPGDIQGKEIYITNYDRLHLFDDVKVDAVTLDESSIIKSHDGFVSVYSEIGNGTTFKMFLPAEINEESSRQSEISPKMLNGNGELVLVVDDEPGILRVTKMILEKHNYRVLEANDGPEALALFAQQMDSVNIILADIMMPYMDGVMLIRAIRKMKPAMKFIASTGQGEETRVPELETLHVANFLTKPYDTERLLKTLRDTLTSKPSANGESIVT